MFHGILAAFIPTTFLSSLGRAHEKLVEGDMFHYFSQAQLIWLEPSSCDTQEGIHLSLRFLAVLIVPAVEFGGGSGGGEPTVGPDLVFECGIVICFFLREHIGLLCLSGE